jgi:hypothetical protein
MSLSTACFLYLGLIGRIAWIERRCGVWFRSSGMTVGTYIRRPGVTPEAAATALQRYARETHGRLTLAQFLLLGTLASIPLFVLYIGGMLLSTWLSTQWIPA